MLYTSQKLCVNVRSLNCCSICHHSHELSLLKFFQLYTPYEPGHFLSESTQVALFH